MKLFSFIGVVLGLFFFTESESYAKSPDKLSLKEESAFLESNWEDARVRAVREGKMIVVDFSAKWCLPCRWMEEETFEDKSLIEIMKSQFISLNYDIESFDGVQLKHQYSVRRLPTILILSPEGEEIKRYSESMSANALIFELTRLAEQYHYPENPYYKVRREGLKRQEEEVEHVFSEDVNLFFLQFGVFSSEESAQKKAESLNPETEIKIRKGKDKNLYVVVSKAHFTREKAEELKKDLFLEDNIESLIKKLN